MLNLLLTFLFAVFGQLSIMLTKNLFVNKQQQHTKLDNIHCDDRKLIVHVHLHLNTFIIIRESVYLWMNELEPTNKFASWIPLDNKNVKQTIWKFLSNSIFWRVITLVSILINIYILILDKINKKFFVPP